MANAQPDAFTARTTSGRSYASNSNDRTAERGAENPLTIDDGDDEDEDHVIQRQWSSKAAVLSFLFTVAGIEDVRLNYKSLTNLKDWLVLFLSSGNVTRAKKTVSP
eukprot:scaffold17634_cov61-Cylindrotheca_fusiformis.AAC.1